MSSVNLVYNVEDKPKWGQTIIFAFQQLLAILAATIAVPAIINNQIPDANMSPSAALLGAGVGTLVYLLFTKFKSPVFLGSSFAFIGSMLAAFGGAVSASAGYLGIIIGALLAGLVYVVIAIIVKFVGTAWITKLMPAIVIGPTVAIIGLSLAGNAVGDLITGPGVMDGVSWIGLACGLVTLFATILVSIYGNKFLKMIPFIIGIVAGYAVAAIFTGIGAIAQNDGLKVIDFSKFAEMEWLPRFSFIQAFNGFKDFNNAGDFFGYFGSVLVAYVPVAFVVFAEHMADHRNLSSIIDRDLLKDPGLHRTLLGDGVGSMAGAFFGGCPNTTYGESIGTVAISGNASIRTIFVTSIMAIVLAFIAPFSTFLSTIPSCVMGGVCIALYGFIAVSGLKMIQSADLGDNRNLFVASVILIAGIGGLQLVIDKVTLTSVACALILGILVNLAVNIKKPAFTSKLDKAVYNCSFAWAILAIFGSALLIVCSSLVKDGNGNLTLGSGLCIFFAAYVFVGAVFAFILAALHHKAITKRRGVTMGIIAAILGAILPGILFAIFQAKKPAVTAAPAEAEEPAAEAEAEAPATEE